VQLGHGFISSFQLDAERMIFSFRFCDSDMYTFCSSFWTKNTEFFKRKINGKAHDN
jgi:hypothetical protein